MLDLIFKGIVDNSNKIDVVVKHINKIDKRNTLLLFLLTTNVYLVYKKLKKQEEKITELEIELEGMKSNIA